MKRVAFSAPDLINMRKHYMVADMHFHTCYSHDCSTPVEKILEKARLLGIRVAITDHNTIGGVLKAYETPLGRKLIIPGIEVTTKQGKDILIYFYDVRDLVRFFEQKVKPHKKQKSSLRSDRTKYSIYDLLPDLQLERCVVAIPHPVGAKTRASYGFFQRRKNQRLLSYTHAIEVINETMTHKSNLTALGWAIQYQKPMTAGSDGHMLKRLGEAVTAAHVTTRAGLLDAIKHGHTFVAGKELGLPERVGTYLHIVKEKARIGKNRRMRQKLS